MMKYELSELLELDGFIELYWKNEKLVWHGMANLKQNTYEDVFELSMAKCQ